MNAPIDARILVPKLCLGTRFAKLCFASTFTRWRDSCETEFRGRRSHAERENEGGNP